MLGEQILADAQELLDSAHEQFLLESLRDLHERVGLLLAALKADR